MRVLLTGATGLIGRATLSHLVDSGYDVVAVIPRGGEPTHDHRDVVEWIARDLSVRDLDLNLGHLGIEAVVHLAAIPSPGGVPDDELFINNAVSTSNLLYRAAQAGVRRFVLASSVSIYGYVWSGPSRPDLARAPLSETARVLPADGYALTKVVDEAAADMYARTYDMSIASLRFPNVGTADLAQRRRREVMADPSVAHRELWAYLTLEDAARAIERALLAIFTGHVAVNVASTQSLYEGDVRDLIDRFFPEADNAVPAGAEQCGYDTRRAEEILGFVAERVLTPTAIAPTKSQEQK